MSPRFDAYWNSASAYPVAALIRPAGPQAGERVRAAWTRLNADPRATHYRGGPARHRHRAAAHRRRAWPLEWAPARMVSDDPAKVLHPPERKDLHMLPLLEAALGRPARELDLVSPYFVPTEEGTAALVALAAARRQGARADQLARRHRRRAGARRLCEYREELLRGGVRLYELKRSDERERQRRLGREPAREDVRGRSRAVFIGSFNFDPRSARLNTEMGVVIDSPALAERLSSRSIAISRETPTRCASPMASWNGSSPAPATPPNRARVSSSACGSASSRSCPIEWPL